MKRIFRRLSRFQTAVLPGAVAAAIALPSGAVVAQPAMLEEVIVMAQKREQSLQDVGIAITAFSGEQLDSLGINSSTELSNITPNLNIVSPGGDGGVVAIFIRGIGLNDFSLNNTGPVGFYVDEVFAGSSNAQITTIFDTERVEVLKGPQGTLFGRNTTGGALNFISKKPEDQFGAEARVSYGNFDYYRLDGVVTGPMSDNVNGRLALVGYGTDGYIKNLSTGDTVERQNLAGRALFDYQPTDTLSFLLNLNASRNDSDSELYGTTADPDFYEGFHGDLPYKIKVDTYGGSLKASYDVTDTIGFTSITAYDNLDKDQNEDADMTPLQLVEISYQVESDLFTQELRLNGDTDNTHWIAGLYYLYEDMQFGYVSNLTDLGLGMSPSSNKQELQTAAAFGQIEYDFNERWALTAGARYTYIDIDFALDASFPILGVLGFQDENNFEDSQTDGQWSGKIGLDYTPTNDHLFYASIAKGFKGGGFNGGLVSDFANYPDIAEFD
ncbi:MAG: TonB-dependent receptor, partial [Pseudomonadota bacterium]